MTNIDNSDGKIDKILYSIYSCSLFKLILIDESTFFLSFRRIPRVRFFYDSTSERSKAKMQSLT